jgi:ABC-type sugar transport system ATPase subunit
VKQVKLLQLKNISKSFPGVSALQDVNFELNGGEIIGLVGENGAGKSTLMSIIAGVYSPTTGEIFIEGVKVLIHNPSIAQKLGVSFVPQEPALAPNISAAENIFLGREALTKGIILNRRETMEQSKRILVEIGADIDPVRKVADMNMAEKEAVGIAKAMLSRPRILILDEVTSPLDQVGVQNLFRVINRLRETGIGIIFISHRLREVFEITDKIVVLRDGRNEGVLNTADTNKEIAIKLMVGQRKMEDNWQVDSNQHRDKVLLTCEGLCSETHFSNVSFDLYRGEILGLAGLRGAGMSEVAKALFGLVPISHGKVHVNGQEMEIRKPLDAMEVGIGYIPPDRQQEGLATIRNVEENINITMLEKFSIGSGLLNFRMLKKNANEQITALRIKTPNIAQKIVNLSGGNQQKVMISKWLGRSLEIFIFDEPTRGVDVGAKDEIHKLLIKLRNRGKGLLVISSELPELLVLCDRIILMEQGTTTNVFSREEADEEIILRSLHAGSISEQCAV